MIKNEMIEKMRTFLDTLRLDELFEFFSQRNEKERRILAPEALRWIKSQKYVRISLPFGMTGFYHGNALLGHEVLSQLKSFDAISRITKGKSPHEMLAMEDFSKIKEALEPLNRKENIEEENRPIILEAALIALASTASCKDLLDHWRHLIPPIIERSIEIFVRVFHDRKPDWLPEFLSDFFTTENGQLWPIWRILTQTKICPPFRSDSIYHALFEFAESVYWNKREKSTEKWLEFWKNNSDLLEDFWYPFEHPTQMLEKNWNHCFCSLNPVLYSALVESGLIDRNRFLNALLESLFFEYPDSTLKGFVDLLTALNPTLKELSKKQERLFHLFDLQKTSLYNLVCQTAVKLQQNSLLNTALFLEHAGTVFNDPPKGLCLKILKLTDKIVQKDPSFFDAAFSVIRNGLVHKTIDVQTAAANLILKYFSLDKGAARQFILSIKEQMFPSVTLLFDGLLTEDHKKIPIRENELKRKFCKVSDVPSSGKTVAHNGILQNYKKKRAPIIPLQSAEELLDRALSILETGGDSTDYELLLDGINRIHWQDLKESQNKTSALQKKLINLFNSFESGMYFSAEYIGFGRAMMILLSAWCGHIERDSNFVKIELSGKKIDCALDLSSSPTGLFNEMVLTSCLRLADRQTLQLLSTPTDSEGWIDPVTLVKRLPANPDELHHYDSCDIILSLYRLSQEHRKDAAPLLKNYAAEQSNYYIETLRALLENREELDKQFPEYYKKAFEYDQALRKNQPLFRFNYESGQMENIPEIKSNDCPDRLYYPISLSLKELNLCYCDYNWGYAYLRWRLNLSPGYRAAARSIGLDYMFDRIESVSSANVPNAFLDDLIDSDQIIDEMASLILVPALTSKSQIYSLTAKDVLISAIGQNRFRFDLFAKALRFWLNKKIPKPNRWLDKFQQISDQSPVHAENIKSLLELVIKDLPNKLQGGFLVLLYELCLTVGGKIENFECKAFLNNFKGSANAVKTVKKLKDLSD